MASCSPKPASAGFLFSITLAAAALRHKVPKGALNSPKKSAGETYTGKPNFLCCQPRSFTFLEFKAGKLNYHLTHESSRAALQSEYEACTGRITLEPLSHSLTSSYLYRRRPRACLDHGFNHSLFKVLALQAEHGWQRYTICFDKTPPKRDAIRYLEAGLVFCTLDTLPDMLRTIELTQHAIFLPFVFHWFTSTILAGRIESLFLLLSCSRCLT
jgi:hypothetical protein